MKKNKLILIFAIIAMLIATLAVNVSAAGEIPFIDVPEESWYYNYVKDVYEKVIMKGKSQTRFDPDGYVSRAEFVTALARLAGESVTGCAEYLEKYPDAKTGKWYSDSMGWGVKVGIVKGKDNGRLEPNAKISRAELVTFMGRLVEYMGITIPGDIFAEDGFSDVKRGKYYYESLELLRAAALITGDGTGRFNPGDTAQRHSMAALLSRFAEKKAEAESIETGLAVITIETETGRDVESKEEYIYSSFTLKGPDGRDISADEVRIRGRGNATWKFEKKSYRLKFSEDVCLMKDGETMNKDWTLLANHGDKSLIRNHVAQSIARTLDGIEWAPYTELVEVYLNGEYRGVYMLSEQVEAAKDRVDIEEGEEDDIGLLIELDGYAEGEYNKDFFTVGGTKYTVKSDIKDTDQGIAMKLHLETILNVIKEGDRDKVAANVDLDSAVDMYLVYEQMRNLDAGWSSFYMYFYEPHGKLYFGPPWDFDLAGGNSYNCQAEYGLYVGHYINLSGDYVQTTNEWFASLMSHEWFREMVRDRFNEKSDDILDAVNAACKYAYMNMEYLDRNFEKWDVLHELICQEPMDVLMLKDCTAQVEYLGDWIVRRHEWLKELYNSEEFINNYDSGPETEYGVTEVIESDVWTIADWFEGDKMAQVYMDILFSGVETKDGRIITELGLFKTLKPENFAKRLLEEQLGAEAGRYTFVFDEEEYQFLSKQFSGLGIGEGVCIKMTFTILDLKTGEESLPALYEFCVIKRNLHEL